MTGDEGGGLAGTAHTSTAEAGRAAAAAAALDAIWVRHRDTVLADVSAVDDAVRSGVAGRPDDGLRSRAGRAAHKLAGSCGTFGFPVAGAIAGRLEDALTAAGGPPLDQYPALGELVLALRCELDGDSRGARPQPPL